MATIKSYTSLEQSKVLAKILPIDSADMGYNGIENRGIRGTRKIKYDKVATTMPNMNSIPCWSLAALINVLPSSIKDSIGMVYSLNMNKGYIEYSNPSISSLYSAYIHTCGNDNLADACVEMIIKLKELNLL